MKKDRLIYAMSLASLVTLCGIFYLLSPDVLPPFFLLVVFALIYLVFLGVGLLIFRISFKIFQYLYRGKSATHNNLSSKTYLYISIISLAPILLLALASIGKVSWYELFLVSIMASLICFYIRKKT